MAEEKLIVILNKCDLSLNCLADIEGIKIIRDKLIKNDLYEIVKEDIMELKKVLSSSFYTCIQKDPEKKQKWPLINFMRQLLKTFGYIMKPIRESDGYTPSGKKKYKRYFIIVKKNICIKQK